MSDTVGKLAAKIAKAALEVGGALAPDKRNQEQRYDYISADKILSLCGQALFNQGVVVFPNMTGQNVNLLEYTDQYGKSKKRYDATVNFAMTVTDGETAFTSVFTGVGNDYVVPDKAVYKAITSGHKYFLMKLLCIGAGNEDGEHEQREEEAPPAKKSAPAKSNGKPAQPPPPDDEPGNMVSVGQALGGQVKMALETALNVETSDGVKYGTIPSERLSQMSSSLTKKIKAGEIPPDERETAQMKLDAIAVILASRAAAQPN